MRTKLIAAFLLAGISGVSAQTLSLTSTTPTSSGTIGGGSSVRIGTGAGAALTNSGANNVFIGTVTGAANTSGANNTFMGWAAAPNCTTGEYNVMLGRSAGTAVTTSFYNTFVGGLTGLKTTSGSSNTFIGFGAGNENVTGGNNTVTGWGAGATFNAWGNTIYGTQAGSLSLGDGNVFIGQKAGYQAGSSNVMIGANAGYNETGNSKLYIDMVSDANLPAASTPLIWGDFASDLLKFNGKVGVGAVGTFPTNPLYATYKLFVTGGILTDEVRVAASASGTWADYVFADDYDLKPLAEVEAFIVKNKHLPNVPSAAQVKEDGINLADMARIQQEKIEELMLYVIDQNKQIQELKQQVNALTEKK